MVEDYRVEALAKACQACVGDTTPPEQVVARAKAYLAFLEGDDPDKPAEGSDAP